MKSSIRSIFASLPLAVVLLLPSCAPTSPAARIEKFPARFEALPAQDKDLVSRGELKEGMSEDAVFFLWGQPNRVISGQKDSVNYTEWVYTRSEPVYSQNFAYGWGFGYGYCGSYPYGAGSWGTNVDYIRVPDRVVRFEGGVVTAWKMRR